MHPRSHEIYDEFAPHYRHYSEKKSRYLSAIDELVFERATGAQYVLDVGCGDGVRGAHLAHRLKPKTFVMIDSSTEMLARAKKFANAPIEVAQVDIAQGAASAAVPENHFEVALCLWNVFGHIIEPEERVQALLAIKKALTSNGMLLVDVSNRYNTSHYGLKTVTKNIWRDLIHPKSDNGTFAYDIDTGSKKIRSHCHFFTPREFPQLCERAGLHVTETFYVHYEDGSSTNRFRGHAFYVVKKRT